jgi:BirA family biotin operon repressor/biotin-[acetyl-CoA-carboxylase] ligase
MNSRTWQLLRLLADGEFHSGQVLGQQLGVSRATVFSSLASVEEYGVVLQRIRGRGYRLAKAWSCLDADAVQSHLGDASSRFKMEVLQQAASSNTELLRRATAGAPTGSVLAVELQTAGRGRIGRTWHSGLGNALTFSLLWRFDCGLNGLSGLSLAVGLAILRALKRFDAVDIGLKWPNDILAAQGKLGGVLIEAQGDMYGPSTVVIGIGINCTLPFKLEQVITQPAVALDQLCAAMPERNELLSVLLQELAQVLDAFARAGFASLRADWEAHHVFQNQSIKLQMPDGSTISGIARGVSDSGELLLETSQGIRAFNSGEVGVRR